MIRVKATTKAGTGPIPQCLGQHQEGESACDDKPICSWRRGCRATKTWCALMGLDPADVLAKSPSGLVRSMATRMSSIVPKRQDIAEPRCLRAWARFLAAFRSLLPPSVRLVDSRDLADIGDLYVHVWGEGKPAGDRCMFIRVKAGAISSADFPIVRYEMTHIHRIVPTIFLRCELKKVLHRYPRLVPLAWRWDVDRRIRQQAWYGARAIRVAPEAIDDFGRVAARLLRAGMMRGLEIRDGLVVRTSK